MDLKEHEKWIKENLGGQKMPLDSSALWEDLEKHVPAKKSRKKFFIFLLAGIALFAISALWLIDDEQKVVDKTEKKPAIAYNNDSKELELTETSENLENTSSSLEIYKTNHKSSVFYQEVEQKSEDTKQSSQLSNSESIKVNSKSITSHIENNDNKNATSTTSDTNNSSSTYSKVEDIPVSKIFDQEKTIFENVQSRSSYEDNSISKTRFVEPESDTRESIASSSLEMADISSLSGDVLASKDQSAYPLIRSQVAEKSPRLFLLLSVGSNITQSKLITENSEFESFHNNSAKAKPSSFIGLQMQYNLSKKVAVKLGVDYMQQVSEYQFKYVKNIDTEEFGIAKLIIDKTGHENESQGTITVFTNQVIEGKWYQRMRNLALQAGIDYSLYQKNRWDLRVGTGISSDIIGRYYGSFINSDLAKESLSETNSKSLDNWNLYPYFDSRIDYRLNKNFSIGASFLYHNRNKQTNFIDQKSGFDYRSYKLGLTCRYGIN